MKFKVLVRKDTSIREAIGMMASSDANKHIAGVVVVVDGDKHVTGIVTDGDVRRGLGKNIGLDQSVALIAHPSPITVKAGLSHQQMRLDIIRQAKLRQKDYQKFHQIILVDDDGKFHDLVLLSEIFDHQIEDRVVAVYGMGFVGLTLASVLANAGLMVVGVDTNPEVIRKLRRGVPTFFENGLESMLDSLAQTNPIRFIDNPDESDADIHIVCVGTPVDKTNSPDFSYVNQASEAIARKLKKNDLVIFRSTLPVGSSRHLIIPILEKSGMKAGIDFYVSFAPERTVEGNALEELRVLPQIIGGFDKTSCELAARLFSKITNTIVEVESLEAAEMVKLLNNTYRDLVFSFANEVAMICDGLNLNAFKLIEGANEGYPRNPIPMPSPGVGGICLAKDPYLYTHSVSNKNGYRPVLGVASRSINSAGHMSVLAKIRKFCDRTGKDINTIKIYLIGLSFKGVPETSDIRESIATKLVGALPNPANIHIKDFVVGAEDINALGCPTVSNIMDGFAGADIVLVMNNHPLNSRFNIADAFKLTQKPFMIFDGWNMFNQQQIESFPDAYYATLGYMSECEPS
ncbi:MAG: nucleotide sugar dehydrogenase [Gammaproteobacteria bacterium]|nr:nucleotide sugar dehydrogenase [Gammaproteobacteria bacterium]MBU1481662.1 nucleotide sugar dehydrogenase [Gammaproteobacteria bacterium]